MATASEVSLETLGLERGEDAPLVTGVRFRDLTELVRETVELTEEDLKVLAIRGPEHSQAQIKHIRAYHHMVALRLALGERPIQISAALGLTPQTITKLQASPQFAELVDNYRGQVVQKAVDHIELMSMVSAEALLAIHERLASEDRSDLPMEMLRRLAETFVDRIGHSPVRRSETSNVHRVELDDRQIARIKGLHQERRRFDPAGVLDAAFTSGEQAAAGAEPARGAAVVFLAPPKAQQDDSDASAGESV